MAVLLGRFVPGSPEWHAARAHGIGGSEVAPILGLSPWESRFSLWHRKAGMAAPVQESPEMEWGTRLEAAVLQKYRDEHHDLDFDLLGQGGTYCHEERPWQIANPDLLAAGRVVEAKCSRDSIGWGQPGSDDIPIYYRTQCIWYGDVLDVPVADVCVLIGGNDYREYTIRWTDEEAAELRTQVAAFLEELAAGIRPDIDEHSATYQVIKELHPGIDGTDIELDGTLARQYIAARAVLAGAEGQEQLARSLVADAMGNARRATWDGHTIATRQARGDGTPYVVASRALPAIDITEGAPA